MFRFFRKDIEKCCAYCARGSRISEEEIACPRRGVMDAAAHCSAFVYDPLKRVPPRPVSPAADQYTEEDFKL